MSLIHDSTPCIVVCHGKLSTYTMPSLTSYCKARNPRKSTETPTHPLIFPSAIGVLALKYQSTTTSPGDGARPSRVFQLKEVAGSVGRWVMITAGVLFIDLASVK